MSFIPADVGIHVTPYKTWSAQTALSPKDHSKYCYLRFKSAYEPSDPLGRSLLRFLWHEVTGSISPPPLTGCYAIAELPQHYIRWYPFMHLNGGVLWELRLLPKNTTQRFQPRAKLRPLDPETSALIIWPPCLQMLLCLLTIISEKALFNRSLRLPFRRMTSLADGLDPSPSVFLTEHL